MGDSIPHKKIYKKLEQDFSTVVPSTLTNQKKVFCGGLGAIF